MSYINDLHYFTKLASECCSDKTWATKAGKNPKGGLNAKGRAAYNSQHGSNLKRPVSSKEAERSPAMAKRRASFCARMSGMKKKLTGSSKANDPNSRINLALKKWDC